jgi:RND family efflux transporter MFP subunit
VAVLGPAVEAVYATGTVEPVLSAEVGPAIQGRLVALLAKEGEPVAQGQVVARLDDSMAAAHLIEAETRARYAAEDAARLATLAERGVAARSRLDLAESEARATAALAEAARKRLDDYLLKAPIAGRVLRRDREIGEMVDTNEKIFWIGEPGSLRITAEVDEEDIVRVRPRQRALLKADAFPDRVLEGEVASITPQGDPIRKTYRVRIGLPSGTPLMVGMTVEANIIVTQRDSVVLVPARAVRDGVVFVLRSDEVAAMPIETGVIGPSQIEVRRGIAAGERIVLDPPPDLADGQRVRPAAVTPGPVALPGTGG